MRFDASQSKKLIMTFRHARLKFYPEEIDGEAFANLHQENDSNTKKDQTV